MNKTSSDKQKQTDLLLFTKAYTKIMQPLNRRGRGHKELVLPHDIQVYECAVRMCAALQWLEDTCNQELATADAYELMVLLRAILRIQDMHEQWKPLAQTHLERTVHVEAEDHPRIIDEWGIFFYLHMTYDGCLRVCR